MADSKTPTPPPPAEQGQPTRPSTFDASWDAADASVFDPTSLPLAKAPRAWERQPHSPFARNGKYRKVWKRNETRTTRSKTKAGDGKEVVKKGEQSGTHTPRKVVKKRALDALPADTTATPGRVRPKSKAFAATRYDSPRRQSGRIARKLVSTGLSESGSDAYGSVWTGTQSQKNTAAKNSVEHIHSRDAQSADSPHSETMEAVTQDSTASEAAQEEPTLETEQKPAQALDTGEDQIAEQVVEQETAEQEQTKVTQDPSDEEGTEGDAIPGPEEAPNGAALESAIDTSELSSDLHEVSEAATITTDQETAELQDDLEQHKTHEEGTESRHEVPGDPKIEGQPPVDSVEQTTEAPRKEGASGSPEASGPLVEESVATPETAAPDMPVSSIEEVDTSADTTASTQMEPTGVPENHTDTDADIDVAESHAFWLSVAKAKQEERDAQRAENAQIAQEESVGTPEIELTTEDQSFTQESSGQQNQLEEEQAEAEQPAQSNVEAESPKEEPTLVNDASNGISPQDTSSTNQQEPARRPNLEFSASKLFGEAPEPSENEKEQEGVDQDTNLRDGYDEGEDSLIDMPSPSLSNNESPNFASVADTLTLNLPDKLYTKDDEASEEEPGVDSPTDVDAAYLREFLSRSDAAKAKRATISKRESLTNRRDSGRVRQALESPRVALETKDPNSPQYSDSPYKRLREGRELKSEEAKRRKLELPLDAELKALVEEGLAFHIALDCGTLDITEDATPEPEAAPEPKSTRRSSRARTTRLPATPSASAPNRIPVRRADGNAPVVLKKTEAQELAIATRTNTRKNKSGAVAAPARLKKLQAEALKAESSPSPLLVCSDPNVEVFEASRIKWDQQLVYFQEKESSSPASLSDDELATGGVDESLKSKKAATSRAKRTKGLGASNGTPAKGLLAPASLLPESVVKESEASKPRAKKTAAKTGRPKKGSAQAKEEVQKETINSDPLASLVETAEKPRKETPIPLPKPNPPRFPPSQLPMPASAKKSRLQSPKKIKLPEPAQPAAKPAQSKAGGVGITGGTPKKMPATRLSATSGESSGGAAGSGMSIGQRRRAGRRA
ncbi:hypothetical protein HDK77DRAFT_489874 [Phyllosticta capitalensis]